MPSSCSVLGCNTKLHDPSGYKFHRFPRLLEKKKRWISNINRGDDWYPDETSRICSKHFIDGRSTDAHPHPVLYMGHALAKAPESTSPNRKQNALAKALDSTSSSRKQQRLVRKTFQTGVGAHIDPISGAQVFLPRSRCQK